MPVNFPFSWLRVSPSTSIEATVTLFATTTTTLIEVAAPSNISRIARFIADKFPSLEGKITYFWVKQSLLLFLLLSIPLVWWLARQGQTILARKENEGLAIERKWQQPWQTKDWNALYGLIALGHEKKWMHTPFRDLYLKSIRQRWDQLHRISLRRLLWKGIIPLNIQDGGLTTEQIHGWKVGKEFPYLQLPRFRQAKKRACFEFLVPHPEEKEMEAFLELLVDNNIGHGVTLRYSDRRDGPGHPLYSMKNPPYHVQRPFAVGAESAWEILLPFKADHILEEAWGERTHQYRWYLKALNPDRIPLIRHNDSVVARIESSHWGHLELDSWVLALAQIAKMKNRPADVTLQAAKQEIRRCGLSV